MPDMPPDETANPRSGTGAGLLSFITYLIDKKEMVAATASALRTGCAKVLSIDSELPSQDLRTADVDDIVRRFRNGLRGQIKEKSLDQYEQRFRQAVTMYRKWLNDEPDWLPKRQAANGSAPSPRKAQPSAEAATSQPRVTVRGQDEPVRSTYLQPGMVTYPIPIRPGVQGSLVLPENLSKKEAQRVANFVNALAFDEVLALPAGSSSAA